MGRTRINAQTSEGRISSKTAAKDVAVLAADADIRPTNGVLQDAADFNLDWTLDPNDPPTDGLPRRIHDPTEFDFLRDKPVYGLTGDWDDNRTGDNNVFDQLDSGWRHDVTDNTITWGFFEFKNTYGLNNSPKQGEGKGYSPFTAAQKEAALLSIATWDDIIAPEFVKVEPNYKTGAAEWARNDVDIWLANTTTGPAQAWAYYPGYPNSGQRVAGDVWIADPRVNASNAALMPGGYGTLTLNHELGHAIGLSHPGNYNFSDDVDGVPGPDPITYEGDAFYFQDSHQYTIMSYFDSYEVGSNHIDWNLMRADHIYPATPMVHDIWAAQEMYGAEMSTRAGDTTYGFNATADVTNEAMRFEVGERHTVFSIWDGAGEDTLDLSEYHTPSVIDLREGSYSSAGGLGAYNAAWVGVDPDSDPAAYLTFVNANNAALGLGTRNAAYDLYFGGRVGANEGVPWSDIVGRDFLMEHNIGIAYGATIENAIGGHGDDRINGNQADNEFTGGGGADRFIIADYSTAPGETTLDGQVFDDESVDTIMDFESGVDTIDLSELNVTAAALSYSAVDGGTSVTVERGADDLTFIVLGDSIAAGDIYFG